MVLPQTLRRHGADTVNLRSHYERHHQQQLRSMRLCTCFFQMGAGLAVGLCGVAAGFAIGIVGDAGCMPSDLPRPSQVELKHKCYHVVNKRVLNNVQQPRLYMAICTAQCSVCPPQIFSTSIRF